MYIVKLLPQYIVLDKHVIMSINTDSRRDDDL